MLASLVGFGVDVIKLFKAAGRALKIQSRARLRIDQRGARGTGTLLGVVLVDRQVMAMHGVNFTAAMQLNFTRRFTRGLVSMPV